MLKIIGERNGFVTTPRHFANILVSKSNWAFVSGYKSVTRVINEQNLNCQKSITHLSWF